MNRMQSALIHLQRAQEQLEEAQRDILAYMAQPSDDTHQLLIDWHSVDVRHDELDDTRKKLHAEIEAISRKTIPEIFGAQGVKSIPLDSYGFRFTVTERMSVSMPDKEGGKDWLRANGLGNLIIETVNASTLSSAAKNLLEQGVMLPEEHFKTSIMAYTSATKLRSKKSASDLLKEAAEVA